MPIACGKVVDVPKKAAASLLTLDSGITLVHQEIPSSFVVSVDVYVNAGAASEPQEAVGIAHFLEHMVFKGTEEILPGEFDWAIETQGGMLNAATSHDYAHYTFTTAAAHFTPTLAYLADLLLYASIPADEFEQERFVVIEEIRQALDDPDWLSYQELARLAYGDHPYARSILGDEATLLDLTPECMRDYHRRYYRPDNMTIAVVGAVSREAAMEAVTACFPAGSRPPLPHPWEGNRPLITRPQHYVGELPSLQQGRLHLAWMGPSSDLLHDALGLELVATILAGGRTSRLVRYLREELGWVHDIGSGFSMQRAPSLFAVSACLDRAYVEPVEHEILRQVADLGAREVSIAELDRAKRVLCNSFAFGSESPSQLAAFLGYHSLLGCRELCAHWSSAYARQVQAFQPEDVLAIARQYLSPSAYAATSLLPGC